MKNTYSITEAQAKLPALVRESADHLIAITRHDEIVGYFLSRERMEAILETMEILADPAAMKAIRKARSGRGKYRALAVLDED